MLDATFALRSLFINFLKTLPEFKLFTLYYNVKRITLLNCWLSAIVIIITLFSACQNGFLSEQESVDFFLPPWDSATLPELSRWKISVRASDFEADYYLNSQINSISFKINRNEALSVTATPVTKLSDGSETIFFKPAGAIYPYSANSSYDSSTSECLLTWEGGFTATIMQKIINSKKESKNSNQNIKIFLSEFNWKKMQDKISRNISDSISSFENPDGEKNQKFYNPWHIDDFTLLDNLTFAVFESKYLNTTYILSVSKENAKINAEHSCLSSFIPENQIIKKHNVLTLKKKTPQSFLIDNTYAARLNASSSKKISADITYMPILLEDYAHSK